jgi:hypothetical protein
MIISLGVDSGDLVLDRLWFLTGSMVYCPISDLIDRLSFLTGSMLDCPISDLTERLRFLTGCPMSDWTEGRLLASSYAKSKPFVFSVVRDSVPLDLVDNFFDLDFFFFVFELFFFFADTAGAMERTSPSSSSAFVT